MIQQEQPETQKEGPINYSQVLYTFTCLRRHLFKDKIYHVHILPNMIAIGENFNDPNPKYKIEMNLKNTIHWKQENGNNKAFGIKYKKSVKYFEANPDHLAKFRQFISCLVSFVPLDDHYKIEEQIGKGSFSSVYKIFRQFDSKVFAMKYVSSKQKNDKENMQLLENEIGILNSMKNEHILKIFEVYRVEEFHYAIIIEYLEGMCLATLIDQIKKNTSKLKENDIKAMMHQLLKALAYLHSQDVIHRDIKPQNIMVLTKNQRHLKVIDFGLSIRNSIQFNRCGTPGYMAPEIVNMKKDQQKPWTALCDMFSLGVVFFKLLSKGVSCFQGQTSDQVLANNKKCQIDWQLVQQYNYSKHTIALLKSMLARDPEERISSADALQQPYFSDFQPLLPTEIAGGSISMKSKFHQTMNVVENNKFKDFDTQLNVESIIEAHNVYTIKIQPSKISRSQTIQLEVHQNQFD